MTETIDYLVIGAGSAGCVIANRLALEGGAGVCVLEAGPRDTHPFIHIPAGFMKTVRPHYDPDKAKYHLKQAGLDTLTVKLHAGDIHPGGTDAALLFKEHARQAGVDIEVVREPTDGYWSNVWMQKDFSVAYWGGRPTEDWMFSVAYADDSAWNDTCWKHEKFNQLLTAARAELDNAKRREK